MKNRPVFVSGLALALAIIGWLLLTGVGLVAALLVTVALALQAATGGWLWAWVRGRSGGSASSLEILAVGFALGTFLAMASGVLLRPVVPGGFGWAAPSVIVFGIYLFGLRNRSQRGAKTNPKIDWPRRSVLVGLLVGCGIGLAGVVVNLARYRLQWSGLWDGYHPDMLFFEGLATGLARFGPGESIFMVGADLRYHWFAYAWIGQLSDSLGLEPFIGLTRVLPLMTVIGSVALAASWAARHSKQAWVPSLAAVLIAAGGYLGATYGTLLNFDSPSQAMTTVWVLALSFVLLEYLAGNVGAGALWLIGALGVACVGGKASAAIVTIGAMAITWVLGLLRRCAWQRRVFLAFIVLAVPGALTYLLVLFGSASSGDLRLLTWDFRASSVQGLDLGSNGWGIAAGTALLMLAIVPRWAGLAGFWLRPETRWAPQSVFGFGLVIMALAPLILLSQGVNELWFALTASAPLSVLSAIGCALAWGSVEARVVAASKWPTKILWISIGSGILLLVLVSVIWAQGANGTVSVRAVGPVLAIALSVLVALAIGWFSREKVAGHWVELTATALITILVSSAVLARATPVFSQIGGKAAAGESLESPIGETSVLTQSPATEPEGAGLGWSDLEVAAAAFLRAISKEDDIVVTNLSASALVPALTGLRTYLAGAPYQTLYGRQPDVEAIPVRVRVSERFTSQPSEADFLELCSTGVTWVWISGAATELSEDWSVFAKRQFQNEAVTLLSLNQDACGAAS